ncbi:MAG: hypothetical protein KBT09_03920 [Bacteroidales bacterium]|nr:hypothetical protein [Candidatus Sodaliphilus fimicaballi]
MKQEDSEILKGIGKETGFKVPENYFAEFNKRMMDSLPPIEIKEETKKVETPSMWVRVRPYLYAAATFAGIWCMMTVFNNMNGTSSRQMSELAAGVEKQNKDAQIDETTTDGGEVLNYQDSVMMSNDKAEELPSQAK